MSRTITFIGDNAFQGNQILMLYRMLVIRRYDVLGNDALQSILLPTKMLSIGQASFQLNALTSLVLPTSIIFIDQVSKRSL